jgi:hypothetical protein
MISFRSSKDLRALVDNQRYQKTSLRTGHNTYNSRANSGTSSLLPIIPSCISASCREASLMVFKYGGTATAAVLTAPLVWVVVYGACASEATAALATSLRWYHEAASISGVSSALCYSHNENE